MKQRLPEQRDHRQTNTVIDLNGPWAFQLDPDGALGPESELKDTINVPGTWQGQGFGEPRTQLRADYQGKTWYQRRVELPSAPGAGKFTLELGTVLRRASVYVNGKHVGDSDRICVPVRFDITAAATPNAENVISVMVDNLAPSGKPFVPGKFTDTKFWDVSDPYGAFNGVNNWGGLTRGVRLITSEGSPVVIPDIRPDFDNRCVHVGEHTNVVILDAGGNEVGCGDRRIDLPDMRPWTPDDPYLYTALIDDQLTVRIGMRSFTSRSNVLLLNHRPYYLRGYSVGRGDPIMGGMQVSKDFYLDQFTKAKAMGFNYGRWHSMPLPAEAFEAADEMGFLIQSELPNVFTPFFMPLIERSHDELEQYLLEHRHHPSLLAFCFGNEFNIERDFETVQQRQAFLDAVQSLYDLGKRTAPDTFIMANCGYPVYPTDLMSMSYGFVDDRPCVRHESGSYRETLPPVHLIENFTGVITAEKLEAKKKWIEERGLEQLWPRLHRDSIRMQFVTRKRHFETTRLMRNMSGYQYWQFADSPPDPYMDALEDGILDYFYEPKEGWDPDRERMANDATVVLLANDPGDRTSWAGEGMSLRFAVSHYGDTPLAKSVLKWRIGGVTGELPVEPMDIGELRHLEPIATGPLAPGKAALEAKLSSNTRNQWDLWALARGAESAPRANLIVTDRLDGQAFDHVAEGGSLLWFARRGQFDQQVDSDYLPTTLAGRGTIVEDHPAFADFPHDGCCEEQFCRLMDGGFAMKLPDIGRNYPPEVRGLAWPANTMTPLIWGVQHSNEWVSKVRELQRVAWVVEARVGPGRVLISTFNVDRDCPEARAMRESLVRYASSDAFSPKGEMPVVEFASMLAGYLS